MRTYLPLGAELGQLGVGHAVVREEGGLVLGVLWTEIHHQEIDCYPQASSDHGTSGRQTMLSGACAQADSTSIDKWCHFWPKIAPWRHVHFHNAGLLPGPRTLMAWGLKPSSPKRHRSVSSLSSSGSALGSYMMLHTQMPRPRVKTTLANTSENRRPARDREIRALITTRTENGREKTRLQSRH